MVGIGLLEVIPMTLLDQKFGFDGPPMVSRTVTARDHIIRGQEPPGHPHPLGFVDHAAGVGPGFPAQRDVERQVVRLTRCRPRVVDRIDTYSNTCTRLPQRRSRRWSLAESKQRIPPTSSQMLRKRSRGKTTLSPLTGSVDSDPK